MLKDILRIIDRDGLISRPLLAKEINVTAEMIDSGIDQLIRMEYLLEAPTGENCATICTNCPFATNCSKEIVKSYSLSPKGQSYLQA